MRLVSAFVFAAFVVACGSTTDDELTNPTGASGSSGTAAGGTSAASGGAGDDGGGVTTGNAGAPISGPVVRIHVASTAAPITFTDGFSGQTPQHYSSGIRSYRIYRDENDPAPVTVFDLGNGFVDVPYADGVDTVVATVPLASLPAGHFTRGRVVHAYVDYAVDATVHSALGVFPGTFHNVQVMSDHTTLMGVTHDAGYYSYTFDVGGMSYPVSGTDAKTPVYEGSGGFEVVVENGEWAYYFPTDFTIDPTVATSFDSVMTLNIYDCFRWQDTSDPGYAPGVFDVTTTMTEPVEQFGANGFSVSYVPAD